VAPGGPKASTLTYPLRAGDVGPLVARLQVRLTWLNLPLKTTRIMDAPTMLAIAAFRAKYRLGKTPNVTASVAAKLAAVTHARSAIPKACTSDKLALCIDKTQRLLRVVSKGKVILTVDARFGNEANATREGSFRVFSKSKDHISSLYKSPMPFSMFFSGGQAVHYSKYFNRDGYAGASHGCVNLRDKAVAALLFKNIPIGTRVVVYSS
jgi:lipoprotein-anchoring transpeptidase ErfK/SrfK